MHAFDIASSSSLPTKRLFGMSAFDHLIKSPAASQEATNLLQPLLALQQLHTQAPTEIVFTHLSSLFAERSSDYAASISALTSVCEDTEAEYEKSESPDALARFAQAKADLARSQLAAGDYEDAIANSQTSLDLSSGDDLGPAFADGRAKCRLEPKRGRDARHHRRSDTQCCRCDLELAVCRFPCDVERHAAEVHRDTGAE